MKKEKSGFGRIGFLKNFNEYLPELGRRTGWNYIDPEKLDQYVNAVWDEKREGETGILSYRLDSGTQKAELVPNTSEEIRFFLVCTGLQDRESGKLLYEMFKRDTPRTLDARNGWTGVAIGTAEELVGQREQRAAEKKLDDFTSAGNYQNSAQALSQKTGNEWSADACAELLRGEFVRAQENGELAVVTSRVVEEQQVCYFALTGCQTPEGEPLYVKMYANKNKQALQEWFGAYIVTRKELQDELFSYLYFRTGDFLFDSREQVNAFYNGLAKKAMPENWDYEEENGDHYDKSILKSYLEMTFYRLKQEDADPDLDQNEKIARWVHGKVYFNSGLLDRFFRQIIIAADLKEIVEELPVLGECRWNMLTNLQAYSENDYKLADVFERSEWLPKIASFFHNREDVVFDASLEIKTRDRHIVQDGVERGRLPRYTKDYQEVKESGDKEELEGLISDIADDVDKAIQRARLLAARNYKLAVPQYWKETGKIQFLLPLYMSNRDRKPECALVCSRVGTGNDGYYRGETILTLGMAYNNARLIAKPDVSWLDQAVEKKQPEAAE